MKMEIVTLSNPKFTLPKHRFCLGLTLRLGLGLGLGFVLGLGFTGFGTISIYIHKHYSSGSVFINGFNLCLFLLFSQSVNDNNIPFDYLIKCYQNYDYLYLTLFSLELLSHLIYRYNLQSLYY